MSLEHRVILSYCLSTHCQEFPFLSMDSSGPMASFPTLVSSTRKLESFCCFSQHYNLEISEISFEYRKISLPKSLHYMAKRDFQVCLIKLHTSFLWLMAGEGVRDCSHKKDLMQVASRSREWTLVDNQQGNKDNCTEMDPANKLDELGSRCFLEPTLADTLIPEHSIQPNTPRLLTYRTVIMRGCYFKPLSLW